MNSLIEPLICHVDEQAVELTDARYSKRLVFYPFSQLEVGKSFTANRTKSTLWWAVRRYKAEGHKEMEFKIREIPEGGCRVWRVK